MHRARYPLFSIIQVCRGWLRVNICKLIFINWTLLTFACASVLLQSMRHTRFELQRIYLCMRMGSDDPERMASLMGHVKNRMKSRQSDRVTMSIMVLRSDANEKRRQVGGYRRVTL